jgi:hypothetical protein
VGEADIRQPKPDTALERISSGKARGRAPRSAPARGVDHHLLVAIRVLRSATISYIFIGPTLIVATHCIAWTKGGQFLK